MSAVDRIEKRLAALPDRTLRYHYVIQLGRRLPPMPPELKTEANRVRGCMSPAWLHGNLEAAAGQEDEGDGTAPGGEPEPRKTLRFVGDSESVIVKGLFAILAEVYNGHTPEAALAVDLSDVFERLNLGEVLSPNRRNGFYSMVETIRRAAAYLAVESP